MAKAEIPRGASFEETANAVIVAYEANREWSIEEFYEALDYLRVQVADRLACAKEDGVDR